MEKIILGLDPGTVKMGYGLIKKQGSSLSWLASGLIKIPEKTPLPERLVQIFSGFDQILKDFKPQEAAVEKIFFAKNAVSAISLGYARGILLLGLQMQKIPIFEYTPTLIKQSVTNYGRSDKEQIAKMVRLLLNLPKDSPQKFWKEDETDALAVAICHSSHHKN